MSRRDVTAYKHTKKQFRCCSEHINNVMEKGWNSKFRTVFSITLNIIAYQRIALKGCRQDKTQPSWFGQQLYSLSCNCEPLARFSS